MHKNLLTIAYPTFNRSEIVLERVNHLQQSKIPEGINVLVIDNCSEDKTYETLREATQNSSDKFRILKNHANIGFAGNFFRLFEEAESEYLMISSDEDEVLVENLEALITFLSTKRPSFVSGQAIVFDKPYRGQCTREKKISLQEFQVASGYISGIIFRREEAESAIKRLSLMRESNVAVHVYPQVLLMTEMLLIGNCFWFPKVLTVKRHQVYSSITNPGGDVYYHLVGRSQQLVAFLDYFDGRLSEERENEQRFKDLKTMKGVILTNGFAMIRSGLEQQNKEVLQSFDIAARSHYSYSGKAILTLRRAFKNPEKIIPYIFRRMSQLMHKL